MRSRIIPAAVLTLLLATLLLATLLLVGVMVGLAAASPDARPRRIEIVIHYSSFEPTELVVPHGVPITFVLMNGDPIDHEWLLGNLAFQARHRTDTEPFHGNRPTEVSLPPLSTDETTLTFDAPGTLQYICHVPGHEAYGMVGTLTIT